MGPQHHPWSKNDTIILSLHNPAAPVEPQPSGKGFGSTKSVRISVHLRLTASITLLPSAPAHQGRTSAHITLGNSSSVWSTCQPINTQEVYTHSPDMLFSRKLHGACETSAFHLLLQRSRTHTLPPERRHGNLQRLKEGSLLPRLMN